MKRNIPKEEDLVRADAERLEDLITQIGRMRSLRDPLAHAVEEMQLTPPQMHALRWLSVEGSLTMGVLARRLGVTEKTVTGLVDRLEKQHLVERVRLEGDRRVIHARLTKKGAAASDRLRAQILEGMRLVLGVIPPEDRQSLFRIIENLVHRMQAAGALAPTGSDGGTPTKDK